MDYVTLQNENATSASKANQQVGKNKPGNQDLAFGALFADFLDTSYEPNQFPQTSNYTPPARPNEDKRAQYADKNNDRIAEHTAQRSNDLYRSDNRDEDNHVKKADEARSNDTEKTKDTKKTKRLYPH